MMLQIRFYLVNVCHLSKAGRPLCLREFVNQFTFSFKKFQEILITAFATIYVILKYFSKISFSQFVMIYRVKLDFFLVCFSDILNSYSFYV